MEFSRHPTLARSLRRHALEGVKSKKPDAVQHLCPVQCPPNQRDRCSSAHAKFEVITQGTIPAHRFNCTERFAHAFQELSFRNKWLPFRKAAGFPKRPKALHGTAESHKVEHLDDRASK